MARLYLANPLTISVSGQPTNFPAACEGTTTGNRVVAIGGPALTTYQWHLNGKPLAGQTRNGIDLTNLRMANAGNYHVVVANMCGSETSSVVSLTVHPAQFEDVTVKADVTNAPGYCLSAARGDYRALARLSSMWTRRRRLPEQHGFIE